MVRRRFRSENFNPDCEVLEIILDVLTDDLVSFSSSKRFEIEKEIELQKLEILQKEADIKLRIHETEKPNALGMFTGFDYHIWERKKNELKNTVFEARKAYMIKKLGIKTTGDFWRDWGLIGMKLSTSEFVKRKRGPKKKYSTVMGLLSAPAPYDIDERRASAVRKVQYAIKERHTDDCSAKYVLSSILFYLRSKGLNDLQSWSIQEIGSMLDLSIEAPPDRYVEIETLQKSVSAGKRKLAAR